MNIREQWSNFSLREKQTLMIGGAALILFLAYEIIWAPLANKMDTLRDQVQTDRKLLIWMQNADASLAALSQSAQPKAAQSASLLSTMQDQIKKSSFAAHVTQLRQAENNTVQLNLTKVGFDDVTTWLTALWKNFGLVVGQITVTPTGVAGEVNVELVLRNS